MDKQFSVDGNAMNTEQILNEVEGIIKIVNCTVTINVHTNIGKTEKQ